MTSLAARRQPSSSPASSTELVRQSMVRAALLAKRQERLSKRIKIYERRLYIHQNARLSAAGGFFLFLIFLAIRPDLHLEIPAFGIFVPAFTFLVIRTRRIFHHLTRLKRLQVFFDRQEKRCRGLVSGRPWEPAEKVAGEMAIARDLGLLGQHSLWSLIDETMTDGGQMRLLEWMARDSLSAQEIQKRQTQLKSLRRETWFFTRLALEASADDFRLSSSQILKFIKKPFVEKNFLPLFILSLVSWIAALSAMVIGFKANWQSPGLFLLAFAVINLLSLMKVGSPFLKGVGLSHHLSQLAPIFEALEKRSRTSEQLQLLCPATHASGPSSEARKLNRVLAFMSVQANPIAHLLVNVLSPWSITATHFLERRRRKIAYTFPQCLEELAELEALMSLVIFDRYQTRVYPEVNDSGRYPVLSFTGLFHPLIERTRVVANDFAYPSGRTLGLLTGSNMSGKSTFLRTVGLNQILANMGAPVFAETYVTCPLKIETCIEVSDSLRDGFSYFYAEVRRLKGLLAIAKSGTPTLFLIDEIFRGTNNRERQIGSRAVIRSLSEQPLALGFVSTHDLELTQLENSNGAIMNLHFREEFTSDGQMLFSYHLRPGPCPTTNALKIMAAEGIEVDER